MAEIILYVTAPDVELIRSWLNEEREVAWIILESRVGDRCRWKAVDELSRVEAECYALWHKLAGPLNVPSGDPTVPDAHVVDPFAGWIQRGVDPRTTTPFFGGNLPGPFTVTLRDKGRQDFNSLARSGFHWLGDYFRPIGKPAHPAAKAWWNRLRRFVKSRAASIPWPYPRSSGKRVAFAFPEAHRQILEGRLLETNP